MEAVVNGSRMAFDDVGPRNGPCLVLVHGFPLDRRMWQAQLEGLSRLARVVAPDLRGHGESELGEVPVTMDSHADDLAALMDYLDIKQAVIAGLSMGGYVTFAMWRRHPERVAGMVLIDTRAEADTPAGRENREKGIAVVRAEGSRAIAEDMMPKLLAPSSRGQEWLSRTLWEMMTRQPVEGVVGALQALRDRPDNALLLPHITAPVLVIVGELDVITPPEFSQAMAGGIPGARLVTIPGAGHMSPMEDPRSVNQALASFLQELS